LLLLLLLQVAAAIGCHCFIAMPDDAAIEKAQLLQALGGSINQSFTRVISKRDTCKQGATLNHQWWVPNGSAYIETSCLCALQQRSGSIELS
jgi:cysteine synthase